MAIQQVTLRKSRPLKQGVMEVADVRNNCIYDKTWCRIFIRNFGSHCFSLQNTLSSVCVEALFQRHTASFQAPFLLQPPRASQKPMTDSGTLRHEHQCSSSIIPSHGHVNNTFTPTPLQLTHPPSHVHAPSSAPPPSPTGKTAEIARSAPSSILEKLAQFRQVAREARTEQRAQNESRRAALRR